MDLRWPCKKVLRPGPKSYGVFQSVWQLWKIELWLTTSSATESKPTRERNETHKYVKNPLSITAYTRKMNDAAMATRLSVMENINENLSRASQLVDKIEWVLYSGENSRSTDYKNSVFRKRQGKGHRGENIPLDYLDAGIFGILGKRRQDTARGSIIPSISGIWHPKHTASRVRTSRWCRK